MNYPDCKNDITSDDTNSPVCGVFVPKSGKDEVRTKIELWPGVKKTVVLSAFLPGAGQIYCGQVWKGAVMLAVFLSLPISLVGIAVAVLFFNFGYFVLLAAWLQVLPFWILLSAIAALDVSEITRKQELGRKVGEWEFF